MSETGRELAVAAADEVVDAELVDEGPALFPVPADPGRHPRPFIDDADWTPAAAGTAPQAVHTDRDRHLSPETVAAIEESAAASTRRAYGADRAAFAAWCAEEERVPVPATGETVAEWVRHLTVTPRKRTGKPAGPSTIERAMSAVTTWHEEQGHPKPNMRGARAVLNAYKDRLAEGKAEAARARQATAALPAQIRAMLAGVDRSTLAGQRNATLVLVGFATAARVSELVALDRAAVVETEHGYDVTLYRKKVRKYTTNAILYGSDAATCPVRALRAYLAALDAAGRTEGPVFVRVDRWDRIAPPMTRRGRTIGDPAGRMTAEAAAEVVERLAVAAGLSGDWSGHSLRRGFATAARAAGHDPLEIARAGGWVDGSRVLARYMDDVDRVKNSPLVGIGL
ncbi:site-specific integrase [Streptomyces sp. NPDC006147]|uniref:site-specific integrase n=1 Tax=Streptomyces sp. NPDC006147 TaxID=3155597 RepID=UPI0033B78DB2